MSTTYMTPNMSLVIPVPGQQPGPTWASNLNASLTILDAHDHSPGSGVQINPSGINVNSDLSFNVDYSLVDPRSVRFYLNAAALAEPTDLGCIYSAGVDLYYNDGDGNQIRITQSGSVAGSAGTITGLPSGTASAAYQSVPGTFLFQQATSTAANLDVGSIAVRYPGSYPTPSGNYIQIQAPAALATGYALTLPALPAQTNVMTLGTSGIISSVTFDAVGTTMTSVGANAIAETRTRSTGSTVGLGGIAVSSGSGGFTTASTSSVDVTGTTISIETSGRPVLITVQSYDATQSFNGTGFIFAPANGGALFALVYTNNGATISSVEYNAGSAAIQTGTSGVLTFVHVVGAGTHGYKIQAKSAGVGSIAFNDSQLVALET